MDGETKVIVIKSFSNKIIVMVLEGKDKGAEITIELSEDHAFVEDEIIFIKKKWVN